MSDSGRLLFYKYNLLQLVSVEGNVLPSYEFNEIMMLP